MPLVVSMQLKALLVLLACTALSSGVHGSAAQPGRPRQLLGMFDKFFHQKAPAAAPIIIVNTPQQQPVVAAQPVVQAQPVVMAQPVVASQAQAAAVAAPVVVNTQVTQSNYQMAGAGGKGKLSGRRLQGFKGFGKSGPTPPPIIIINTPAPQVVQQPQPVVAAVAQPAPVVAAIAQPAPVVAAVAQAPAPVPVVAATAAVAQPATVAAPVYVNTVVSQNNVQTGGGGGGKKGFWPKGF